MNQRTQRDDDDQPDYRKSYTVVQPTLDASDQVKKAREILAKTVTKTKENR
jgi:hypothetical protein